MSKSVRNHDEYHLPSNIIFPLVVTLRVSLKSVPSQTLFCTYTWTLLFLAQDFTLDFYFRQFWTDPRLAFRKRPGVETLSVGSEFIKNIWVPDTFFVNEKQSYFHIATTSNEFIRIHHSGSITRSIRYTYLYYYFITGITMM